MGLSNLMIFQNPQKPSVMKNSKQDPPRSWHIINPNRYSKTKNPKKQPFCPPFPRPSPCKIHPTQPYFSNEEEEKRRQSISPLRTSLTLYLPISHGDEGEYSSGESSSSAGRGARWSRSGGRGLDRRGLGWRRKKVDDRRSDDGRELPSLGRGVMGVLRGCIDRRAEGGWMRERFRRRGARSV